MRLFAGTPFDRPPKCEHCGALETECRCPPPSALRIAPERQVARLALEKRKTGRVVTVVRGLSAEGNDLPALLSRLKSQCGAGGTIEECTLEIQGAHVERIRMLLGALGYIVKS